MVKAIIFDLFGVLYRTPPDGYKPGSEDVTALGMVRNQELLDYIKDLRARYKIGVLSNLRPGFIDEFFSDIERHQLFDTVVVSSEVGLAKPQPEIFYLICQRLGVQPNETIFVDDRSEHCEGAKAVGMHAIVYKSNQQAKKEIESRLY